MKIFTGADIDWDEAKRIFDELSSLPKQEGTEIILESTAHTRPNPFWKLFTKTEPKWWHDELEGKENE